MMNILVISDTHGEYFAVEEVLSRQLSLDEKFRPTHLIHLGDGVMDADGCALADKLCIHKVRGNCDSIFLAMTNSVEKEKLIEFFGYKILIMHGDGYGVKLGDEKAIERAISVDADLLLYGHTHTPLSYIVKQGTMAGNTVLKKDLQVMNPGSLRYGGNFGIVALSDKSLDVSIGCIK